MIFQKLEDEATVVNEESEMSVETSRNICDVGKRVTKDQKNKCYREKRCKVLQTTYVSSAQCGMNFAEVSFDCIDVTAIPLMIK